jgi:hypothetical protein
MVMLIKKRNTRNSQTQNYRNDRTAYTKAKHFFVTDVIEKAKLEAGNKKSE